MPEAASTKSPEGRSSDGRFAFLVGAGILLSRIAGLIRDRVFAHYFGNSDAADAFRAAFRIPNFLQNLFGEGTLSASFIPVYAKLLAEKNQVESRQVASGVAATLGLIVSILVLAGVLLAAQLVRLIAPGFEGEKRELCVSLVRIFFPGAGLLVCSAWCLGVLNSHRRFFLSYAAPIVWNAAIIAALLIFGRRLEQFPLAEAVAWASVLGSALQFLVQCPLAFHLMGRLRAGFFWSLHSVRTVGRNFIPVFIGRGVIQVSAFVDEILASFLGQGAVAGFGYAATLYALPISLFGMSVSASELPAMSSALGNETEVSAQLVARLNPALRRIAVFVVPSTIAFLALGDVIVGAIYQTGQFLTADVWYVWGILAGATVGLLAQTMGRLYSSAYYALRDTRTPLRYAILRVSLTALLGYVSALLVPKWIGVPERFGVVGLTISAGLAGWLEFYLLRRTLNRRIGLTGLPLGFVAKLWLASAMAAVLAYGLHVLLDAWHPIPQAGAVLGLYGILYFLAASWWGVAEARSLVGRIRRLVRL